MKMCVLLALMVKLQIICNHKNMYFIQKQMSHLFISINYKNYLTAERKHKKKQFVILEDILFQKRPYKYVYNA